MSFGMQGLEPEPGQFRFDWLDRAMDLLLGAGLQLMLGTPSAAPPRWMLDRFPDMLAENAQAQPRRFGSRRHYCFSHAGYREAAAAMAARLAERYADRVSAWQIDNEYGCHDTSLSYSRAAERAFQVWLAEHYEDIDALNEAWGTRFWSMEYRDFSDIALPQQASQKPTRRRSWHSAVLVRRKLSALIGRRLSPFGSIPAHPLAIISWAVRQALTTLSSPSRLIL